MHFDDGDRHAGDVRYWRNPTAKRKGRGRLVEALLAVLRPAGVVVRTHEELDRLIRDNPYAAEAAADGSKVHVGFLAGPAGKDAATALDAIIAKYPQRRDRYHLAVDTLYLHLPDGAAETKFSGKGLDKAIGVIGTGRNWNTVLKLHAMSKR